MAKTPRPKNPQIFDNPTPGMQNDNAKQIMSGAESSPTGQVDVHTGHNGDHHKITTVKAGLTPGQIRAQVEEARERDSK